MSTTVVVGGGIAGMLAARLLADRFDHVYLVEKDPTCGGLLGSTRNADGVSFDFGAHVISDTGVPEMDALLYENLDPDLWREFRIIRAGNYFCGKMNPHSPFPDARCLGETTFRRGFQELVDARMCDENEDGSANLAEALERRFGVTFARSVLSPALLKQLGVTPDALHSKTPFALPRIICGDAEESRLLKQNARLESPVAFASYEEGVGIIRHRYPRKGGIGQWVYDFEAQLSKRGVDVLTGRTVIRVLHTDGTVTGVVLDDGRALTCDPLVWTIPSAMLLRAAAIEFESRPPTPRPIGLYHLVFDRPFVDQNYHVTCYDADRSVFRVTLYPNLRGDATAAPYNCTAEVIGDRNTDFATLTCAVVRELAVMGIVDSGARLISSETRIVPMGFPATTHAFLQTAAEQAQLASRHLSNTLLLGRAKCPPFFTHDVLVDAYHAIIALDNVRAS